MTDKLPYDVHQTIDSKDSLEERLYHKDYVLPVNIHQVHAAPFECTDTHLSIRDGMMLSWNSFLGVCGYRGHTIIMMKSGRVHEINADCVQDIKTFVETRKNFK